MYVKPNTVAHFCNDFCHRNAAINSRVIVIGVDISFNIINASFFVCVLLTIHLNIILVINQLDAQIVVL